MSCSAYLWGGLIKNKGGVGLFQISQKERLFHVLYQPSYNLAMWSPFAPLLHPSKKGLSFPFSLDKKRIYLETQLKGEFTDCFENFQVIPCSHRQSRNRMMRMMNTFIIVNIASCPLQESLPSHFTWALFWKKSLLITVFFWKLPEYSLFLHRQCVDRGWWTLC